MHLTQYIPREDDNIRNIQSAVEAALRLPMKTTLFKIKCQIILCTNNHKVIHNLLEPNISEHDVNNHRHYLQYIL